jgi:hypothetical protein
LTSISEYTERLEAVLNAANNIVRIPQTLRTAIERNDKLCIDEMDFRISLLRAALKELMEMRGHAEETSLR